MKVSEVRPGASTVIYDIPEVAAVLRLSRRTIYKLINRGELRTFKVGRSRRVTKFALEEFIAAREERCTR